VNLSAEVLVGNALDALKNLPDDSVQTVVTSPPYWGLRDYGNDEQLGLEKSPLDFIENLCKVFDEVWRVLKDDGTLWLNIGDTYVGTGSKGDAKDPKYADGRNGQEVALNNKISGLKTKELIGVPWRVAFALQARGWYLRQDIIWAKSNPMPESVRDRCTKSHEYIFLMTKNPKYFYDHEAIKEDAVTTPKARDKNGEGYQADYAGGDRFSPGERVFGADGKRNKRDVWNVPVRPYEEAHFAVYPPDLIEPCILAGSKEGDTVLDPFSGSGTTGEVALKHNRNYIGLELNPEYAEISRKRLLKVVGMFGEVIVK